MVQISAFVDVDAPQDLVFAAATAWEVQHEWIPLTRTRTTQHDGRGVGGRFAAFTGVGRLGFDDPMIVTVWDPPHRCLTRKTGKVVKGSGCFEVSRTAQGLSRFTWTDWSPAPFGTVGEAGALLVRPALEAALGAALRRFRTWVESGRAAEALAEQGLEVG